MMLPQCSTFYWVKCHILVVVLHALWRSHFLDWFLSDLYGGHSLLQTSTVFGDATPNCSVFYRLCRAHFLTDFFWILYRGALYSNLHTNDFGDAAPSVDNSPTMAAWRRSLRHPFVWGRGGGGSSSLLRTKGWRKNRCQCRGMHSCCAAMHISIFLNTEINNCCLICSPKAPFPFGRIQLTIRYSSPRGRVIMVVHKAA